MAEYFKVVRNRAGRLFSAFIKSPFDLEYIPGQWTEARIGGILVFTHKIFAVNFSYSVQSNEIWSCEVDGQVELPPFRVLVKCVSRDALIDIWTNQCRTKMSKNTLANWPAGTVAYERVKLVEKIDKARRARFYEIPAEAIGRAAASGEETRL